MQTIIVIILICFINSVYGQTGHIQEEISRVNKIREQLFLEKDFYNIKQNENDCLRLRYIINPGWGNTFSIEVFMPYVTGKLGNEAIVEFRERFVTFDVNDTIVCDKVVIKRRKFKTKLEDIESLIEKCKNIKSVVSPLDKGSSYISDGEDQLLVIKKNKKTISFVRVAGDPGYIEDDLKLLFKKLYNLKEMFQIIEKEDLDGIK